MIKSFGKVFATILLALLNCCCLTAQDSVVVYQEKANLFSNNYVFFPNKTFKHYFVTDDLQVWYGTGTYTDNRKIRTLRFGTPDSTYKTILQVHYESNFERELKISGEKFISKDFYHTSKRKQVIFTKLE